MRVTVNLKNVVYGGSSSHNPAKLNRTLAVSVSICRGQWTGKTI